VVVPRPNSATISADKMNVVYRGVVNPMSLLVFLTVMFCFSPGLTKVGNGKYNMSPGGGNEVVISVTGKMSDGKVAIDKKAYRIKVFLVEVARKSTKDTGTTSSRYY
jgi:hypothetical protein